MNKSIAALVIVFSTIGFFSGCKNEDKSVNNLINPALFQSPLTIPGYEYAHIGDDINNYISFNNKLYISGYSSPYHYVLWEFDGVNPPAIAIDFSTWDINQGRFFNISCMTVYKNKLYYIKEYSIRDTEANDIELWAFDGVNPPSLVMNGIKPMYERQWAGRSLFVFNDKLYFTGAPQLDQWECWVYDGTTQPQLAFYLFSGQIVFRGAGNFITFKDKLFFTAKVTPYGSELWVYDGVNTPSIVADINPDGDGIAPYKMIVFKEKLYFTADDGRHGPELWAYDGVNAPFMVADINKAKKTGSIPYYFTIFNDKLYFSATDDIHGSDLWVYDGTNAPELFYDFNNSITYAQYDIINGPMYISVLNNKLYLTFFEKHDSLTLPELWVYDGVDSPRMALSGNNKIVDFITFNGKIYYSDIDGFWAYDGINDPIKVSDRITGSLIIKN